MLVGDLFLSEVYGNIFLLSKIKHLEEIRLF